MNFLNKKLAYSFLMLGAMSFTSCEDFLTREPLDQITPEQYLRTEADLATYSLSAYSFSTHSGFSVGILGNDRHTDNMASSSASTSYWEPDRWTTSPNGSIDFGPIRNINFFMERVLPRYENGEITGNEANIRHYIGEMYFLRAWRYFGMLKSYGDFPILTTTLPDEAEVLVEASKRQPRNEVARFILSDLDKAIEFMSADGAVLKNKNRLSSYVAQLIKSRVALYEGSWLTYHKGTNRVPNGKGWPGAKLHPGYQFPAGSIEAEADFFLREAMKAAKVVADATPLTQQGVGLTNPAGTEYSGWNDYYEMFTTQDMGKIDEVLFWRAYNTEFNVTHGVSLYVRNGADVGLTKGYVDSYLMKNGLPIYANNSGYKGDVSIDLQKTDRDPRLQLFVCGESDRYNIDDTESTWGGLYCYPYILEKTENRMVTGFNVRKCYSYNKSMYPESTLLETNGCIVFRAAEAYMNYVEASYMLTNSLDGDARNYWEAIRTRAGIEENTIDKTIAATDLSIEAKGDWGVYSAGKTVDATLYNIRRERRSEFIGEGMRMDDLYRWAALNQVRDYVIEGFNLWDEAYERYMKKDADGNMTNETRLIQTGQAGTPNVSSSKVSKYIRPYQIVKENNTMYNGYRWRQAKYLSPVPIRHITLASPTGDAENSNFYQNPGWPTQGEKPADISDDPMDN
ncbi:MAG: RagB/SusD family nutrient uptake outer membrane protein [Bacteroidales bacterium]